jgi:hypothetical protein
MVGTQSQLSEQRDGGESLFDDSLIVYFLLMIRGIFLYFILVFFIITVFMFENAKPNF